MGNKNRIAEIIKKLNIKDKIINILKAKGEKPDEYISDVLNLSASSFRGSNKERDLKFNEVARFVHENPDVNLSYLFGLSGDMFIDSIVQKGNNNTQNITDTQNIAGDVVEGNISNKGDGVNFYFAGDVNKDIKIISDALGEKARQGAASENAHRSLDSLIRDLEFYKNLSDTQKETIESQKLTIQLLNKSLQNNN